MASTDLFLHKVIMVGSGGVGKSALTLQYMVTFSLDILAFKFLIQRLFLKLV